MLFTQKFVTLIASDIDQPKQLKVTDIHNDIYKILYCYPNSNSDFYLVSFEMNGSSFAEDFKQQ